MKNIILTLFFILGISISSYSQIEWTLNFPQGFQLRPGAYYSSHACDSVGQFSFAYLMNQTNPSSYYYCEGWTHMAYVYYCPEGLYFNPEVVICDYEFNVCEFYPDFDWNSL